MSLVFDLAEAINLGVGAITGEATGSLKDWLADVSTRRRLSAAFQSVIKADVALHPGVRRDLADLVSESDVVGFLVSEETRSDLTQTPQAWQTLLARQAPTVVADLMEGLRRAGIDEIVSHLPLVGRVVS